MEWAVGVLLLITSGMFWYVVRITGDKGYKESQLDEAQAAVDEQERINKIGAKNEASINKLSDADVDKLLKDKWTRK